MAACHYPIFADYVFCVVHTEGIWNVWTTTGDDRDAGTSTQVIVTLCGDKAESSPRLLENGDSDTPFQPTQTDCFKVGLIKQQFKDIVIN